MYTTFTPETSKSLHLASFTLVKYIRRSKLSTANNEAKYIHAKKTMLTNRTSSRTRVMIRQASRLLRGRTLHYATITVDEERRLTKSLPKTLLAERSIDVTSPDTTTSFASHIRSISRKAFMTNCCWVARMSCHCVGSKVVSGEWGCWDLGRYMHRLVVVSFS